MVFAVRVKALSKARGNYSLPQLPNIRSARHVSKKVPQAEDQLRLWLF
jgi:hypothetical protein